MAASLKYTAGAYIIHRPLSHMTVFNPEWIENFPPNAGDDDDNDGGVLHLGG